MLDRKKVKRGIQVLLFIFVLSLFIVLIFSIKKETFLYFRKVNFFYLFLSFISGIIYAIFAGLTFTSASLAFNKKIPPLFSIEILLSGYFLASTTPFGSGGLPYQLFLLSRRNIKPGEGSFALYVFGFLKYFYLFAFLLFGVRYLELPDNPYVKASKYYILSLILLMIIVVLILLFLPENLLIKIPLKFKGKIKRILVLIFDEIIRFKKVLPLFFKNFSSLFFSLFCAFISFLSLVVIIPLLYLGLGIEINFLKIFALSTVIYFLVLFSPSPGAIGVAEGVSAIILAGTSNTEILPVLILLWRFFSFYVLAFTGGFFILWRISKWKF